MERLNWISREVGRGRRAAVSFSYNESVGREKIKFVLGNDYSLGDAFRPCVFCALSAIGEVMDSAFITDKGHRSQSEHRTVVEFWMQRPPAHCASGASEDFDEGDDGKDRDDAEPDVPDGLDERHDSDNVGAPPGGPPSGPPRCAPDSCHVGPVWKRPRTHAAGAAAGAVTSPHEPELFDIFSDGEALSADLSVQTDDAVPADTILKLLHAPGDLFDAATSQSLYRISPAFFNLHAALNAMQDEEQETFETVNESPMQNIAVIESASSDTQTPVVSELPTVPDFPVLPSSEMTESDDPGIKEDVNKILSMLADMLAERRTLPS